MLVFNDLVTEVQRSIGYFQGIDRKAKIGGVVVLGNAVKLPGLQQYLAKNLGYEVNNFEAFSHLTGSVGAVGARFQRQSTVVRRVLWSVPPGTGRRQAAHEPGAARDHDRTAGAVQEAVGGRIRRRIAVGLYVQRLLPLRSPASGD